MIFDALSKIPGLNPVMPAGAMFMMVSMNSNMFWSHAFRYLKNSVPIS